MTTKQDRETSTEQLAYQIRAGRNLISRIRSRFLYVAHITIHSLLFFSSFSVADLFTPRLSELMLSLFISFRQLLMDTFDCVLFA